MCMRSLHQIKWKERTFSAEVVRDDEKTDWKSKQERANSLISLCRTSRRNEQYVLMNSCIVPYLLYSYEIDIVVILIYFCLIPPLWRYFNQSISSLVSYFELLLLPWEVFGHKSKRRRGPKRKYKTKQWCHIYWSILTVQASNNYAFENYHLLLHGHSSSVAHQYFRPAEGFHQQIVWSI